MTNFSRRQMILSAAALAAFARGGPSLAFAQAASGAPSAGAAWDLIDLYPSDAAWEAERQAILAAVPKLLGHKGTLGESAASLKAALQAASDAYRKTVRLYVYASLKADEDLRVAGNQERRQQAQDVYTQLGEALAWTSPEILELGQARIDSFIAADPGLGKFRFQLHDTLRQAPHTLSEESEKLIAGAGSPLSGPSDIRDQLTSADIPRPEVTLSDGRKVRLDDQAYTLVRAAPNRADRKLVFESFWGSYAKFEGSLGAALVSKLKGDIFTSRARNYKNSLQWALSGSNIPEGVYRTLVAEANRGLPQLHRYFELRRRMLKLPDIHYYDIYPPLVSLDRKFPLADMRAITLEALKPLGPEYGGLLARGTSAKWMDPLPRQGKSSGAYMSGGAYDVHPYLLLNLGEDYEGLTTYAHEWGHAVHSMLARGAQPWETFDYSIFTAEIASTVNEQLLVRHLMDRARTKEEKLFFLGQQMEQFRSTFFRQTMFAEFELAIHDRAEAGEGLSGEKLAGSTADRDRLLGVLKAGGSDYPTELLRKAGLDMTTPAPYRALVAEFSRVMDQAEALLA